MFALVLDGKVLALNDYMYNLKDVWKQNQSALMASVNSLTELRDLMSSSLEMPGQLKAQAVEPAPSNNEVNDLLNELENDLSELPEKTGLTQKKIEEFLDRAEELANKAVDSSTKALEEQVSKFLNKAEEASNKAVVVSSKLLEEYQNKLADSLSNFADKLRKK